MGARADGEQFEKGEQIHFETAHPLKVILASHLPRKKRRLSSFTPPIVTPYYIY